MKKHILKKLSICYIVPFKFNYYFEDSFEISAFVPQGSGSGSMFVQSLRGDPFRVSSAFYYRYAYTETSFSKCVVYLWNYFRFCHFICFKHRVDVLDMLMDDYFPFLCLFLLRSCFLRYWFANSLTSLDSAPSWYIRIVFFPWNNYPQN